MGIIILILKKLFWTGVLGFVSMVATASFLHAQDRPPDVRLIMIDQAAYATIPNASQRRQAVADLLSDVKEIEAAAPANERTIVFWREQNNISVLYELPIGPNVADALATSSLIDRMYKGSERLNANFVAADLKQAIAAQSQNIQQRKVNQNGTVRRVDLHIFGSGWSSGTISSTDDLMAHDQATACVVERSKSPEKWPDTAELVIEFRSPEGFEQPSHSSMSALSAVLTGYWDERSNIRTRGFSGPLCELSDSLPFVPYVDPSMADNPDCNIDQIRRHLKNKKSTACRSRAPHRPSTDQNLITNPVSVVSKPVSNDLDRPRLTGDLGRPDAYSEIQVSGLVVPHGAAAPRTGGVLNDAEIIVNPAASCPTGQAGVMYFGDSQANIAIAWSRYHCEPARFELGPVSLQ